MIHFLFLLCRTNMLDVEPFENKGKKKLMNHLKAEMKRLWFMLRKLRYLRTTFYFVIDEILKPTDNSEARYVQLNSLLFL